MTWIYRSVQWGAAVVAALALLVAMVPGAMAQEADAPEDEGPDEEVLADDDIRTDSEGVAGYRVDASATPLTVRIFEPTVPLPVEPGQPHLEITSAFAQTTLGAGPVSRAVSSAVWPGFGVGDGFPTVIQEFGGPEMDYPIRASAQYPSGPTDEEVGLPTGAGMVASARGLDVRAESDAGVGLVPDLFAAGLLRSVTTSTVEDGVAVARARSVIGELSVLGGLVQLDGLRVNLRATSDGVNGEESGTFAVAGLNVAGTEFALDAGGARVEEVESEDADDEGDEGEDEGLLGLPLELGGDVDLQELIGVRVEVVDSGDGEEEQEVESAAAERVVEGLRITLDFNPLLNLARDLPLRDVISELPSDLQEQLALILGLTTKVEIGLGSASVAAEVTEPFDLGGGDLPEPPDAPDVASMGDMPTTGEAMGFDEGPSMGGGDDFAAPETAQPPSAGDQTEAPQVVQQFQQASSMPDFFGGLPAPLVALTAALIGAAAFGLQRLTGAALTGVVAGAACPAAGSGVPDLRSWTGS